MDNDIFDDCLTQWKASTGNNRFWPELADKYNFESGEAIRSAFKRERKKRGIEKENNNIVRNFNNFPNVAVIDIETLPASGYFFQPYDVNISPNQLISDGCLLSWAGKLLNSSDMYSDILTGKEAINRDTKRITKSAYEFISSCDLVIGHNWRNFDGKILNTYFLLHDHKPIRYQIIDTLEIAKNNFRFLYNKLAFINEKLSIRNKLDNDGFPLWQRCSVGDEDALKIMLEYNIGDILATENLYYRLRSFMPNHPNLALYNEIEEEQCPVCLSTNLKVEGTYPSGASRYETMRCQDCNSINRRRTNLLSKDKRKSLLARL